MKNEEQLGNNNPEATRCKTGIKWCRIVCTIVVSLVVVLSGTFVMRDGLININKNREYISVKGLAEKEVRSDFAIWMIPINATGDDLDLVRDKIELDVQKTVDCLKKYGIKDEEIEQDVMRIFDKTAQRYYDENNKAKRFAVDNQIVIKTANVDAVYKASKNINDILKDGVTLDTMDTLLHSMPLCTFLLS
ncbi:MAG: SIMPL domain-containing protein [Alphaproteobacteria bacterium]